MGRIDRLRRDDRQDVLDKVFAQPARCTAFKALCAPQRNHAFRRQQRAQLAPRDLLPCAKVLRCIVDCSKLLRRRQAIDRGLIDLATHLPCKSGGTDRQKLIEVIAGNRQEPKPFEQRISGVVSFGENPLVEGQPTQFAIEEATGAMTTLPLSRLHRMVLHHPALRLRPLGIANGRNLLQVYDKLTAHSKHLFCPSGHQSLKIRFTWMSAAEDVASLVRTDCGSVPNAKDRVRSAASVSAVPRTR